MSDNETDKIVDEEVLENAQMEAAFQEENRIISLGEGIEPPTTAPTPDKKEEPNFSQWALGGNGRFSPVGESVKSLPAGVYEPFATPAMWGLERLNISSDQIYELPDMATNVVLDEAERFWNNEDRYRKHNLLFKRGIILYGPAGSGKTVTLKLLMNKLVGRGGIVIVVHHVSLATMALKAVKRIEPRRNLICVFEDIDEIINANGEAILLSMLDGEHNVDRVLNVATTNFPERLGARIINRPSRFDRRVEVDMPGALAREAYIKFTTDQTLTEAELKQWVLDTDRMSIAHLRELVAAVYCLGQPYKEVVERLKDMAIRVKMEDEFKGNKVGFAGRTVNPFGPAPSGF